MIDKIKHDKIIIIYLYNFFKEYPEESITADILFDERFKIFRENLSFEDIINYLGDLDKRNFLIREKQDKNVIIGITDVFKRYIINNSLPNIK